MPQSQPLPAGDSVRSLHLSDFDLRFDRYRLIQPKADLLMARSLAKYDQLAPVIYCQLEGSLVLVDGFKRLRALRTLKGVTSLQARLLEVGEHAAKAAIFNLNLVTSKPNELEESWIIYALVHDDGLPQIEVAQMLGRHKSWVNRRLALIERLTQKAREALRLGLLTPTQAHHLTQLQRCNQNAAMQSATGQMLGTPLFESLVAYRILSNHKLIDGEERKIDMPIRFRHRIFGNRRSASPLVGNARFVLRAR